MNLRQSFRLLLGLALEAMLLTLPSGSLGGLSFRAARRDTPSAPASSPETLAQQELGVYFVFPPCSQCCTGALMSLQLYVCLMCSQRVMLRGHKAPVPLCPCNLMRVNTILNLSVVTIFYSKVSISQRFVGQHMDGYHRFQFHVYTKQWPSLHREKQKSAARQGCSFAC